MAARATVAARVHRKPSQTCDLTPQPRQMVWAKSIPTDRSIRYELRQAWLDRGQKDSPLSQAVAEEVALRPLPHPRAVSPNSENRSRRRSECPLGVQKPRRPSPLGGPYPFPLVGEGDRRRRSGERLRSVIRTGLRLLIRQLRRHLLPQREKEARRPPSTPDRRSECQIKGPAPGFVCHALPLSFQGLDDPVQLRGERDGIGDRAVLANVLMQQL